MDTHESEEGDGYLAVAVPPDSADPVAAVQAIAGPRQAHPDAVYGGLEPSAAPVPPPDAGGAEQDSADAGEYADLDWPDGYAADPAAMAKFIPLARELGLGRDSAQKLASLYAELDREKRRAQAEFITSNNAEWLREIHAHPEFGGERLERSAASVAAVMRRYGTPLLAAQVRQMHVQNWPEMFFFLARVADAVGEDCSPSGLPAPVPGKTAAQLLFPGLK